MPSTLRATSITPVHLARRLTVPLGAAICAALLATACATQPAAVVTTAPLPASGPRLTVGTDPGAPPSTTATPERTPEPTPRALVVATADELVGTRYRYGGNSPKTGFDCSGFVHWVYSRQGIDLPRTTRGLTTAGTRIPARRAELLPGDLLLFAGNGTRITHVAIYVGDGRIIHASSGQHAVRYDDLDSPRGRWFRSHVISARRVIRAGRTAA
ncbi:MAG: C40 family peptidase [Gemmatimonadaceae bacterium]